MLRPDNMPSTGKQTNNREPRIFLSKTLPNTGILLIKRIEKNRLGMIVVSVKILSKSCFYLSNIIWPSKSNIFSTQIKS